MSLLWITATQHEAVRPIPSKEENLTSHMRDLVEHQRSWGGSLPHEQTPEEFGADRRSMWHGSPNGIAGMKVAHYGVHVGTYQAAKQALEARIGRRADGKDWDGTQEYGKTLIGGYRHGHGMEIPEGEARYPSGSAEYSSGHKIPLDVKPHLFPVRIIGGMTNPGSPHPDWHANGYMQAQIKQGRARNGYYYRNEGEDAGSISAVVPSGDHLATHEDFVRHVHGQALAHQERTGREHYLQVPQHNRERYGL